MTHPRLAVIHTVASVSEDIQRRFAAAGLPEAKHVLDASLLDDLLAGVDPADVERHLRAHVDALACAEVVALSCSSLTPIVRGIRSPHGARIVTIDEPMAAIAVRHARLGVLCTSAATVAGSTVLLERAAAAAGRAVQLRVRFVDGAYDRLRAGDRDEHDALVLGTAADLAPDVDAVVLAQASLARLEPVIAAATGLPVLSSPDPFIAEIRAQLGLDEAAPSAP
ncbi:aspartate/glutamate racemase family protein [Salinibacterium sp. ZJ70]|uniref:aspartate/glutamate racemase family protein n=1 Tax=Salinibacterium sp. ZJ70 TaxID=2708084 RepID=UPI0014208783|nr:aspartate/glutamate racemase family protein [Salinibacterium sp. ZJ70]